MTDLLEKETSYEEGELVELFEFSYAGATYRYTTNDKVIVESGNTWTPAPVKRKQITRGENLLKSGLKVGISLNSIFAKTFLGNIPEDVVQFTLFTMQRSDLFNKRILFTGRMIDYEIDDESLGLNLEPIQTTFKRAGFNCKYQRTCRHLHYSSACGANRENFTTTGIVTAINGAVVSVSNIDANPDGHYDAGYIHSESEGYYRMVLSHKGNEITLLRPLTKITVGDTVKLYAGCNLTSKQCRDRFDNVDNYGGFDFIPTLNPFDGTRVF